jgi:hypothetical protein
LPLNPHAPYLGISAPSACASPEHDYCTNSLGQRDLSVRG